MRSIDRTARLVHDRFLALARQRPLRDPLAACCKRHSLGPAQTHALLWLGHDGPLTMGDLARRVWVTEKTVTGIVDRLERAGLLRRGRDAADRRVVRVALTEHGAAASREIDGEVHASLARLLALLDEADRRALVRILDKLTARLGEPQEDA